ncbi:right-handed parallel beta-helix repeat-containing protein [Candidatus Bathyarchaeota archaeon]|nr:right-handed parallel beta-helix repeat-containing protein [Candidatus Bathyarchaeota archaeon]
MFKVGKIALGFILLLLFYSVIVSLSEIERVEASGAIRIRADGNIDGTDKIQRVGDVYTFIDDVSGSIVVERDNLVLDGAGHVLLVDGDLGVGVDLRDRSNVTVKNLTIKGALGRCGILLINAVNCKIIGNNIIDSFVGIEMTGTSSRNRIAENRIKNNSVGMEIYSVNPGFDNIISNNEVAYNSFGMQIRDFIRTEVIGNNISFNVYGLGLGLGSGSIAKNNVMNNNTYGFRAFNIQRESGLGISIVNVDVDTSNTVNGKPIIYWVNQHGKTVPAGVCYVALIGCTGITVKNLDLGGNVEGVFLGSTTNSTIINNRISKCLFGVNIDSSSNNTISGNIITENENGIHLRWESFGNIIQGNYITANTATGIYLADSSDNKIVWNHVADNKIGIYTEYCGTNIIHHNNFINNTKQWDDIGFTPWPIPLPISKSVWDDGEGNYWSDYNGTDADGDGIGDTPYMMGEDNIDHYPLMNPIGIPEILFEENPSDNITEWTSLDVTLLVTAALIGLVTILSATIYIRKKRSLT